MKHLTTILCLMAICSRLPLCCQTTLYNQYKHRTDMVVACAMDFPITDSVKVDVTLFIPKTKEAVYYLAEEFNLGIEKDIIDKDLGDEYSGLVMCNVYKDNVKKRYGPIKSPDDYKNISKLVYNYSKGMIVVFHNIDTKERIIAIVTFLTKTLEYPELFPSVNNVNCISKNIK